MRLQKKSYSRLSLTDLLRRRKSNIKKFLEETGIVSYELLRTRCESMGVLPPSVQEFDDARGKPVVHNISSPMEGIVVLHPPPVAQQENSEENNRVQQDTNSDNKAQRHKKKPKKYEDVQE